MDARIQALAVLFIAVCGSIGDVQAEVSSCPTCLHIGVSAKGIPDAGIDEIPNLSNPDCLNGAETVDVVCSPSNSTTTNKCLTFTVQANFWGFTGRYPDAVMNQIVVSRSCTKRPLNEPDKCLDINQIDGQLNDSLMESVNATRLSWNSSEITGEVCYKAKGGPIDAASARYSSFQLVLALLNVMLAAMIKQ